MPAIFPKWTNRLPVLVTLPQSETELRGGAFDLEGDKLTFHWSVASQPPGAAPRSIW